MTEEEQDKGLVPVVLPADLHIVEEKEGTEKRGGERSFVDIFLGFE